MKKARERTLCTKDAEGNAPGFSEYHNKKKPAAAGTFGMSGYKEEGPESGPSIFIEVMKKLFYVIQY